MLNQSFQHLKEQMLRHTEGLTPDEALCLLSPSVEPEKKVYILS